MSLAKGKCLLLVLTLALLGTGASVLALAGRDGQPVADRPAQPAVAPAEHATDLRDDTPLPVGATARLGTARWHQDGEVFFVAFDRQDRRLITARQPSANRCTLCHRHPFEADPAGKEGPESMVRVWDLRSAKLERELARVPMIADTGALIGENGAIWTRRQARAPTVSVATSPAGDLLGETRPAGPIKVWDLATGKRKELGRADPGAGLVGLAFSPDGKLLASLGAGGRVRVYNVATGKEAPGGLAPAPERQVGWGDAIVFAPSGKLLATSSTVRDGNVPAGVLEIWERDTGTRTLQLKGRARGSAAFGFSPDGRWLAWPAEDGTLRVTDATTGKEVRTLGRPEQTRYLASLVFSPDGRRLATRGYDGAVRLWDVAGGRPAQQLSAAVFRQQGGRIVFEKVAGAAPAAGLAFTHDGKLLAGAGPAGGVTFWDTATGREVFPGHKGALTGVTFAADGKTLCSLGVDGTARTWDVAGRQQQRFLLPPDAREGGLALDGRAVVFRTDPKTLVVWDLAAGTALARVPDLEGSDGHCPGLYSPGGFCLGPDGKLLARVGGDGTVGVWELPSGRRRWTFGEAVPAPLPHFGKTGRSLVFAADGKRLAAGVTRAGPPSASVYLWDVERGKLVRRLDGLPPLTAPVAVAPDGRTLATAAPDGTATLWEIASGKERARLGAPAVTAVTALAYSPDGASLVAAGHEQTLCCWDVLTGEKLWQRRGGQADVSVLTFAPHGRQLVSGGRDGTLLLWDIASYEQKAVPPPAKLAAAEERQCWDDLASPDAGHAARALARLRAAPAQAVTLVRRQVRPAAAPDAVQLEALIKDLDNVAFRRREQATTGLAKLGDLAEPALRKTLADRPPLEVKRRLEVLLDKLQVVVPASGDGLRELRAVELLERLATTEADQVLQAVARGAAGARLTREARTALERRQRAPR
jgi:WD40 repeat protein